MKSATVFGGGPAGLMAAETMLASGIKVTLYDSMPAFGLKFLRAGVGGLNITRDESFESFLSRYGNSADKLRPALSEFGPNDVIAWLFCLGFGIRKGSSRKIFPECMDAKPVLDAWLARLIASGLVLCNCNSFNGIERVNKDGITILVETPEGSMRINADAVILALGGASWPQLGSTGAWKPALEALGITVASFKPANCGFCLQWSAPFLAKYMNEPVKNIALSFAGDTVRGECLATSYGLEGGPIYALSSSMRDATEISGSANALMDLSPDTTVEELTNRLSNDRGPRSLSTHLKKTIGISGIKTGLLREFASASLAKPEDIANSVKALKISFLSPRPIKEAISTAGGVRFENLDDYFMAKTIPGLFFAGEMLDWEVPSGGYLLTACMATGKRAGTGALTFLSP